MPNMAADIAHVESLCIETPWSKRDFEEQLSLPHGCYLVALYQGKVVAFCGAQIAMDSADITNVAVLEEYRTQHIAARLVDKLKKELWHLGVIEIFLEVRRSNAAARTLYKKAGFFEVGERKNYYTNPKDDALIMRCSKIDCEG